MSHKYFTWTDSSGYFKGQELLSNEQVRTLLAHLKDRESSEVFATIQDYTHSGDVIGCPMYFDIDSPSLLDAYEEMQQLVDDLIEEYDSHPMVYFSGSKGFHVVMPLYIRHHRCHEIMKMIASEFKCDIDNSVYRSRSMWRCNNTYNPKGDRFKRFISRDWSLDDIVVKKQGLSDIILAGMDITDLDVSEYIDRLPDRSLVVDQVNSTTGMLPCMSKLWSMAVPPEGKRHKLAHLMSRHFYKEGMSKHEAVAMFASHPFWKTVKARDYEKVIESVYRTGNAKIGCKSGNDADLLQPYCSTICMFREDVLLTDVFGGTQ